jgi:hypothetical protein
MCLLGCFSFYCCFVFVEFFLPLFSGRLTMKARTVVPQLRKQKRWWKKTTTWQREGVVAEVIDTFSFLFFCVLCFLFLFLKGGRSSRPAEHSAAALPASQAPASVSLYVRDSTGKA